MPDIRSRRGHAPRRSARRARVLTFVVLLTSATVSGTVSYDGGPTAARAEAPKPTRSDVAYRVVPGAAISPLASTPSENPAGGPSETGSTRPAPRGMSMDEPIQGGLTAHQAQAVSTKLIRAHKDAKVAKPSEFWTAAAGRTAVARAESWLGMPYSWAGGNATGPTAGRCEPGTGGDLDCKIVGFDCSGLMMYAWGPYASLPHLADTQRQAGEFHPSVKQLLPGDLVFFSGYISGGVGHVAIYTGDGMVIEAPQSGAVVKRSKLKDLIANDGVYRGAVRPLSGKTPALTTPRVTVRTSGGQVILRGTDLAEVSAVRIGDETVTDFVKQTDTALVFRAPKNAAGALAVTLVTPWHAVSKPVTLTYAKPRPKPTKPTAGSTAPTSPSPKPVTSTPRKKSPPKPAPPTTPPPSTPATSSVVPTTPPSTPPPSTPAPSQP